MKVLFAVSTENIADSIIKVYQKKYKEIVSSKNVYYFNAIVKELQRNQGYDRIVISEDLEPYTNNNYDAIDKFIFEKLDDISDEAIDSSGRDIPIILICSERREKSDDLVVKLFSMGVYNALIGQDRKIEDVCKLLNKPRTKKEAKTYYRIEQGEYEHEAEDNVSEVEIRNILTHFKKIAKQEDKYVESFDSIAEQYNDEQLRIIIKFLPIEVKAVLEAESPKYQSIMMYKVGPQKSTTLPEKDVKENNIKVEKIVNRNTDRNKGPIIIPTDIKKTEIKKINIEEDNDKLEEEQNENEATSEEIEEVSFQESSSLEQVETQMEDLEEVKPKKGRGRPRKKPVSENVEEETPKRGRGRPRKKTVLEESKEDNDDEENDVNVLPGIEEDDSKDEINEMPGVNDYEEIKEDKTLNEMLEDNNEEEDNDDNEEEDNDEDDALNDLPGFEEENNNDNINNNNNNEKNIIKGYSSKKFYDERALLIDKTSKFKEEDKIVDISHLITQDKKIVAFIGTSKNGVSFLVNNMAYILSERGINTALVDLTKNKNSFYIYTQDNEQIRKIAYNSMESLKNGEAEGIKMNKNLTVYTSSPNIRNTNYSIETMLTTLLKNYSLVLLDCDYTTCKEYFRVAQEIYLVQSMDVLTIQPLTEFLKRLKDKEILEEKKLKVIINKAQKVKGLTENMIVGGMSTYNDPEMSFQNKLFDMKTIPTTVIPFDMVAYQNYLYQIAKCEISIKGYSKTFLYGLNKLADQVYPVVYGNRKNKELNKTYNNYEKRNMQFSNINNTLDKMKKQYK